jgi:hypothetical protein
VTFFFLFFFLFFFFFFCFPSQEAATRVPRIFIILASAREGRVARLRLGERKLRKVSNCQARVHAHILPRPALIKLPRDRPIVIPADTDPTTASSRRGGLDSAAPAPYPGPAGLLQLSRHQHRHRASRQFHPPRRSRHLSPHPEAFIIIRNNAEHFVREVGGPLSTCLSF